MVFHSAKVVALALGKTGGLTFGVCRSRTLRALTTGTAAVAFLVGISACATNPRAETHAAQVEREAIVTVEAVDVPNRLVTVRTASGDSVTVYVDKSNKDFPQAAVGDRVRIRYTESIAVRATNKNVTSRLEVKEETLRPQAGRPDAHATTQLTAVVRIESVDANGTRVTFTGPRGRRAVDVHDPSMREYVRELKPGDHVEVTYTEALALSLEKVSK